MCVCRHAGPHRRHPPTATFVSKPVIRSVRGNSTECALEELLVATGVLVSSKFERELEKLEYNQHELIGDSVVVDLELAEKFNFQGKRR